MIYGSVCSGIEAASVAWEPLGWKPAFFSEIDNFPRAVLTHRWPKVKCHGDFTTIQDGDYQPIDLLVGGTPCQSFSVAGLRGGLDDDRGNLALEFLKLAQRLRPRWVVWENVPGVLSSNGGRDFGSILAGLGEVGYGFAYRVLDAQYFGLAQRRKRVFVVGYLGDWRRAAAVLFEREGLRGDPAPSREKGKANTASLRTRTPGFGGQGTDWEHVVSHTLAARSGSALCAPDIQTYLPISSASGFECGPSGGRFTDLAPTLDARCKDGPIRNQIGTGVLATHEVAGTMISRASSGGFSNSIDHAAAGYMAIVPFDTTQITSPQNGSNPKPGDPCHPITANGHVPAIAFGAQLYDDLRRFSEAQAYSIMPMNSGKDYKARAVDIAQPIMASGPGGNQGGDVVTQASAVRRLTPTECERLQGFPDGYTLIPYRGKPASDGPRYKALGNSMAVPCMRWIGERIQMVEDLLC
jgi:DNA (cytosine-5)-methyltransferase 1